ncbi:aldehyde dehydrogenase family protein [Microbacterium trichothecenolyticum]|uniref:RHH-type proline utilization regulon transcriptional repressor/proline dehydrogenase/delta 1-pyrroline-5-carboxylate dehydrogenase n=1 Tax=Microbacterium trichothecenolyticum TaxID=69370 RepID=A0ABU0TXR3_MICTR|nr:aldehyde dehydrogenase family protein [Microbacterium trichothecenolyticum]MDQ1124320.1 RHH-type proline utilization regulon transcriptional repressor/proline dehydrogenase/delta 1-pyrroline-5-carboxylate dehydrogenase [Microbacterium trichothecenolyticum]
MSIEDPRGTGFTLSCDIAARAAERAAGFVARSPRASGETRRSELARDAAAAGFLAAVADGVLRPESTTAAAATLHRLAGEIPASLPWLVRGALQIGGAVAPVLPAPAVPLVRRALRDVLGGLVLDARPDRLGAALSALAAQGAPADVRLLGPAVLGEAAARRRLDGIRTLVARDDITRVSLPVGDVVAGPSPWAFDADVERAAERLLPLFVDALAHDTHVTLVAQGRDDLDPTVAVLTRVLEEPRLRGLSAGISVPVAVVESLDAVRELAAWGRQRVSDGGGRLTVRLDDAPPCTADAVTAARHGWSVPALTGRDDIDALTVRIVREASGARARDGLAVEFATADPERAALVLALADDAGSDVTLTLPTAAAWSPDAPHLVVAAVAHPDDLDVIAARLASAYADLVASAPPLPVMAPDTAGLDGTPGPQPDASPSAQAAGAQGDGLDADADTIAAEPAPAAEADTAPLDEGTRPIAPENAAVAARAQRALVAAEAPAPAGRTPQRDVAADRAILRERADDDAVEPGLTQAVLGIAREAAASGDTSALGSDVQQMLFGGQAFVDTAVFSVRESAELSGGAPGFRNVADTDPTVPDDRAWALAVLARVAESTAGDATAAAGRVDDEAGLDAVVARVRAAAEPWGALAAADRAAVLQSAARALADRRGELIEVLASEGGALVAEADVEVSQAVDAAAYYAATAKELDRVPGAVFVPDRVTVVAPRWNAPVGLCAAEVLAALGAGSGVVLTPSPRARRAGAVVAEALWAAGVPRDLLAYVDLNEEASGRALVVHPGVDRVLLAGARTTAERFAAWRPALPLQAFTAGRNAVIVAPSADLDEAVADIVAGAFARAGQAATAASLVILVGAVARSARFTDQLKDAVSSLRVGPADDPLSDVGPLVEEPRRRGAACAHRARRRRAVAGAAARAGSRA